MINNIFFFDLIKTLGKLFSGGVGEKGLDDKFITQENWGEIMTIHGVELR